jgi:FK506-binding protein 2
MKSSSVIVLFALLALITFVYSASKYDKIKNLQVGIKYRPENCDRKVKDGDVVKVHYTGSLTNGEQFDSSIPRGQPFSFKIGQGMVIQGWDSGLLSACVGEKRKLIIPPNLGYGEHGSPPKIPGNSVLIFDVEVIDIEGSE